MLTLYFLPWIMAHDSLITKVATPDIWKDGVDLWWKSMRCFAVCNSLLICSSRLFRIFTQNQLDTKCNHTGAFWLCSFRLSFSFRRSIGLEKRFSIVDENWNSIARLVTSLEESGQLRQKLIKIRLKNTQGSHKGVRS